MTNFLELNNVEKYYGDNHVLRGIDLEVQRHEVACLIGASGCGKSTLLRCVNALETIDKGQIKLDNDVISGEGVDVNSLRQNIGIVFQSFNLFPRMSVLENILLSPVQVLKRPRDEAEESAMTLLKRVGLADKARAYPDSLSGGQQQRVAIVRALASNPQALLLDEITSALDPELVAEVLNIVRDLAEDGMTILMATHEMSFAKDVANQVIYVHQGRVLEKGLPEQIFNSPQEPRTREFLKKIIEAGRL
ncbi:amino acid ABC transporter ATP-binding protein [Brevibacterium antiquum]|uniref:ABC-type polar-amino-acid transporter n=1 Tax=Brevibacterium antiquum TaxID=234835 RepID=A0A2H1KUA6_9MICO|nr:amino acid ABC transporter ATP-binding protein [Brevibacterium antiquum]SMY03238.1 amino acid ABC transporter ATP-binding protein, PAAT family [Brevibacterium antiquum]